MHNYFIHKSQMAFSSYQICWSFEKQRQ
jgi:hypothetical protein